MERERRWSSDRTSEQTILEDCSGELNREGRRWNTCCWDLNGVSLCFNETWHESSWFLHPLAAGNSSLALTETHNYFELERLSDLSGSAKPMTAQPRTASY